MNHPYIITDNSVTVIVNNKPITVEKDNNSFQQVIKAIIEKDWEAVECIIDKATQINKFGAGKITVIGTSVYYNDFQLTGYIVDKIIQFIDEKIDVEPLLNFLNKLMDNPSKTCVDKLFKFLEHKNMPIDPDGDFYAYKVITSDWKDKYTHKIDNSIGAIVEVSRNTVDDIADNACSYGLHAGSIEYVKNFSNESDIVIIVKINPKDVVTVPNEDTRKLRCCRYEVMAKCDGILPDTIHTYDNYHSDWDDDDDDDDDDEIEEGSWVEDHYAFSYNDNDDDE
jgi:hypothetical protein